MAVLPTDLSTETRLRRMRETGARIAYARMFAGMSQPELARHLEISLAALANYESSARTGRLPTLECLYRLVEVLGPRVPFATADYFVGRAAMLDDFDVEAARRMARSRRRELTPEFG